MLGLGMSLTEAWESNSASQQAPERILLTCPLLVSDENALEEGPSARLAGEYFFFCPNLFFPLVKNNVGAGSLPKDILLLLSSLCWLHQLSVEKIESSPLQFPGLLTTDMHME